MPDGHEGTEGALTLLKANAAKERKEQAKARKLNKLVGEILSNALHIEKDGQRVIAFYVPVNNMKLDAARTNLKALVEDINRRCAVFAPGNEDGHVCVASRRFNALSDPKRKKEVAAHFASGDAIEAVLDAKTHHGLFKIGVRCISQRALNDLTSALLAWRADAVKEAASRLRARWTPDVPPLSASAAGYFGNGVRAMTEELGLKHADIFTFYPDGALTDMKIVGGAVEGHAHNPVITERLRAIAAKAIRKAGRK